MKKMHFWALLALLCATPAVYASCVPGPLLKEVFIEFTVKPPRSSESGACTIDLANPELTFGGILNNKYSICVTDSYIAFPETVSLYIRRNCSFTLKAPFEGGGITANGKIEPDFMYGKGTITIKDGKKRQTGKFDLWDAAFYNLSVRNAQTKSRALEMKHSRVFKDQ